MPTQRIQVLIRGSSVLLFHRQTDDVRQVHVYDNGNEANKVEVLLPFDFNLDDVNYNAWSMEMCSLLDAIDIASGEDDMERIRVLLSGAEKYGLTVLVLGDTGGRQ